MISFAKYHGAGNDFILIEDPTCSFVASYQTLIPALCNRHTGIGADGLILLQPSTTCDLKMQIFNADGSEPSMCGNGIRCLVHFARHKQWTSKSTLTVESQAGPIHVEFRDSLIATTLSPARLIKETFFLSPDLAITVVDTGVPHGVIFTTDLETLDVQTLGQKIRSHPLFAPHGINVNFATVPENKTLRLRTYERGVEGETKACGTGIAAVGFVAAQKFNLQGALCLQTQGGHILSVSSLENLITVVGPAHLVFEGTLSFLENLPVAIF